jgi:hypothetical protein
MKEFITVAEFAEYLSVLVCAVIVCYAGCKFVKALFDAE